MSELTQRDTPMLHPDKEEKPEYNSTREPLKLPEYGRLVQEMIARALTIEDRKERQAYAEAIVKVMMGANAKTKDTPDFVHKIWDHLAYISDYRLDIDYPFEINRERVSRKKAGRLSYPQSKVRFRHYGRIIERAIDKAVEMTDPDEKKAMVRLIGNRMKRNLADWKGDGIEDKKVAQDIAYFTEGRIVPNFTAPGEALCDVGENSFRTRRNKGLV